MSEKINLYKQKEFEKRNGCIFCDDGEYAEMSQDLNLYIEKTQPIAEIDYKFYQGSIDELKENVSIVDGSWPQFFNDKSSIFCGFIKDQLVCFCTVDLDCDCIISRQGIRVGEIGCVGTLPEFRGNGFALRMVDLASVYLKKNGCDKGYISYTGIAPWYEKLGYKTFARFSLS